MNSDQTQKHNIFQFDFFFEKTNCRFKFSDVKFNKHFLLIWLKQSFQKIISAIQSLDIQTQRHSQKPTITADEKVLFFKSLT